jgi:AcrR family transcriptional regulator
LTILDAAQELFLADGYAVTSIEAIAARARVSRQTVYDAFGDKAALLYAVGERLADPQAEQVPVSESAAWQRLGDEPDPRARIRLAAGVERKMWERGMVDFEAMVTDAAAADPRLRDLARMAMEAKRRSTRAVAELLFADDCLRPDLTLDDAVDLMVAVDSAAVIRTLVGLGWSYDKCERWLGDFLERQFLVGR